MDESTISESSFDDFESAFSGDDYHIETDADETAEATDVDTKDDSDNEAVESSDTEESSEGENAQEADENGTDEASEADKAIPEQVFTFKVNKEERSLNFADEKDRATAKELLQKGSDYDRVKEQLAQSRQSLEQAQQTIESQRSAMEVLELISQKANLPMDKTIKQLHKNYLVSQGMTEREAELEMRAASAERKLNAINDTASVQKTEEANISARIDKEVKEFQEQFPDVELTKELGDELMVDLQKGVSLVNAYLKHENAKKDAELAELQRKLAAEKQNKKNRTTSPGSQKDSGGRREKSEYDDFMAAFK